MIKTAMLYFLAFSGLGAVVIGSFIQGSPFPPSALHAAEELPPGVQNNLDLNIRLNTLLLWEACRRAKHGLDIVAGSDNQWVDVWSKVDRRINIKINNREPHLYVVVIDYGRGDSGPPIVVVAVIRVKKDGWTLIQPSTIPNQPAVSIDCNDPVVLVEYLSALRELK